ncbi:MAG: hypothetical protein ACFFKA_18210 [Candidatus Thorarchaeota archaeon]
MLRKGSEFLLGLFFSDEKTLVYDNIKITHKLPKVNIQELKSISLKFLGPLFMTRNLYIQKQWKIEYIETSLTPQTGKKVDETLLQSMACLNSTRKTAGHTTNLFTFIGSPFTEDLTMIYERLDKYIHPSIAQGKIVSQKINDTNFDFDKFIDDELKRGTELILHALGSPRKIYWEEKKAYSTIAVIKRVKKDRLLESDLFTFDLDDPLRREALNRIPSYYFIGILPDYYEKRMNDTLRLFGIEELYPNIIKIKISNPDTEVLYIEEFITNGDSKIGYGLVLIPENNIIMEANDLFFYKKSLRNMLDKNKGFESSIIEINSRINPFERWNLNSSDSLQNIESRLDKK